MKLTALGWNDDFAARFQTYREAGFAPARVAREDRGKYRLVGESGEGSAEVTGRFMHDAVGRTDYPAVGDWVVVEWPSDGGEGSIHAVLKRRTAFIRKRAGDTDREQVVAANIDTVLITAGLDGEFNPRRIERYLTLVRKSGAQGVIVLNKTDLAGDPDQALRTLKPTAGNTPVLAVSALANQGLEQFAPYLTGGRTAAFLGSSGVGKSTLINRLLGEERQKTGAIRERDQKGRHTTTHRELIVLPTGGLVIDTPGMRELKLTADEGVGRDTAFLDIAQLGEGCRFSDCRHRDEPGCAVLEAVRRGEISPRRLGSFRRQQTELEAMEKRRARERKELEQSRHKQNRRQGRFMRRRKQS